MQQTTRTINGTDLFTVSNDLDTGKSILIVHGYAEHIMRYEGFMNQLTADGFRVAGYDHKGHGQSGGARAMISSFDQFVEDLKVMVDSFFKKGEDNFLFGHSMGGLIVLLYIQKYGNDKITGVVTTGAAVQMYAKTPMILEMLAPIIAAIWPSFPAAEVDGSTVSRDPNEVEKYNNDPLNYRKKTKAKFGHEFILAQKKAIANMSKINIPIMVQHGGGDKLIHPESASIIYNGISSEDKSMKVWDGLYHELLNEPEKLEIGRSLIDWMNERISRN